MLLAQFVEPVEGCLWWTAVATCGYGNTFGTTLVCDFQNIPCKGNTMLVSGTDAEVTDPLAGGGCRFPCQP